MNMFRSLTFIFHEFSVMRDIEAGWGILSMCLGKYTRQASTMAMT